MKKSSTDYAAYSAILFLVILTMVSFIQAGFHSVLYFYLGMSLITFLTYGLDKHKARKGERRISERTLHCLSLVGGWPGAAIAQQLLRHKTQKKTFKVLFLLTAVLNVTMLIVINNYQ